MINLHNKSVLVIDDDDAMLRALEKVLAAEGCKVTCAALMADAMEILAERKTPIDLVITDLWMPSVTGLSGLYGIHNLFPDLPVIVLTAFGSPDIEDACLRQCAAAFLEKPLDSPQLVNAVEAALVSHKADPRLT